MLTPLFSFDKALVAVCCLAVGAGTALPEDASLKPRVIATTDDFVVAADGSGDFLTVQAAIEATPRHCSTRAVIFIKPGIYKEKIRVPADRKSLSLIGESYDTTILTFDDYTRENIFKANSSTAVKLDGDWNPDVDALCEVIEKRQDNCWRSLATVLCATKCVEVPDATEPQQPRVMITSDGEIDDQCSLVRFLLYANEWDVEGMITSSSQYHWQGHKWPGDDWVQPYLSAYSKVHPNLIKHDPRYPTSDFLQSRTFLGNVKTEGEMDEITPGSQHIVKVLLDETDNRPIWIQAWGGTNTIARALKTIERTIPTGLRSMESPDWGGWGGRYVKVRDNTWLDPIADPAYQYPEGRWYGESAWGRQRLRREIPNDKELTQYLKPIWRWTEAMQNDFASRADWCVKSFAEANHPPVVVLANPLDIKAQPGASVALSAQGTSDPDGDELTYRWWHFREAGSFTDAVEIRDAGKQDASFMVPAEDSKGKTIHVICEVTDAGTPALTRYQRVVIKIE